MADNENELFAENGKEGFDFEKIKAIFELDQITPADEEKLNDQEHFEYVRRFNDFLENITGEARDRFVRQIAPVTDERIRNALWEHNHRAIIDTISSLMRTLGRMPTNTEIARESYLSRETIHKHMREYKDHPLYQEELDGFRLMCSQVLTTMYDLARKGDIRAARLLIDSAGPFKKPSSKTVIGTQNNSIQINTTTITQQQLQHLTPEQLSAIENIVKAGLPKGEDGGLKLGSGGQENS